MYFTSPVVTTPDYILVSFHQWTHLCSTAFARCHRRLNKSLQLSSFCPLTQPGPAYSTHWLLWTQTLLQTTLTKPDRIDRKKDNEKETKPSTIKHLIEHIINRVSVKHSKVPKPAPCKSK